jgi:glycosyltransferase involved in cell wall biosynthesis
MTSNKRIPDQGGPATEPRLAIIIPCWNYADYVASAIRSVTVQGRQDCELIVVDDGSTDLSWDVIQREGVTAYRTANCGQRAACLYGLGRARSKFILFLDADDELEPGSLDTILENLDDRVAKLQFPLTRIDGSGAVIGEPLPRLDRFRDTGALAAQVLETGTYTTPPTSGNVFRRDLCELLEEAEYDRAVDGVILFAAPFFGDVVSLSQALGRYRVHDRNDSGLGRAPDPQLLRRELTRFVARLEHLRKVLRRFGKAADLVAAEQTFFYLERSLYLSIAEGRRVPVGTLLQIVRRIWTGDHKVTTRGALSVFLFLSVVLPNRRAQKGLAYRLAPGDRSVAGFFRALL